MVTNEIQTKSIDEEKLQSFLGQVVTDTAAAWSAPLVLVGDRLGLYQAMALTFYHKFNRHRTKPGSKLMKTTCLFTG